MKQKLKFSTIIAAAALIFGLMTGANIAVAQDYDLVILNGRVIDPETLYDDIANVGITDGRIVTISKDPLKGAETVDATGKIVAPGFIDTHFHFQMPIGYSLGLRDGLTSSMDFEIGLCGILYGRLVRSACRCDTGQLRLCGEPRVCPRDDHRRVGRRRLPDQRAPSPLTQPGRKRAGARRAQPWNRATRFSRRLTKACRLAPPASAAPWAT